MNHALCECEDSAASTRRNLIREPDIVDREVKIRYIFGPISTGPKSKTRR
jgi:hypothetical protein